MTFTMRKYIDMAVTTIDYLLDDCQAKPNALMIHRR